MQARITLQHPTATRRRSFRRSQLGAAARYLEGGWKIVEPEDQTDLETAMRVAETGSEEPPIDPDEVKPGTAVGTGAADSPGSSSRFRSAPMTSTAKDPQTPAEGEKETDK